jgi:hypothetical protein
MRAVFAAVRGLLRAGSLTLTGVGRCASPSSSEKHGIKRIDRLLGNEALADERLLFYRALADRILSSDRPRIVIDWTEVTIHRLAVLCAAVAFDGRAIPIYAETHPRKLLSNPDVERDFLLHLFEVVPKRCRPILVLDAGFRPIMWKTIQKLDWDFVVRIRKRIKVTVESGRTGTYKDWIPSEMLFGLVRKQPRDLGVRLISHHRLPLRIVVADQRSLVAQGPMTNFRRCGADLHKAQSGREPWLLVTSLDPRTSAAVVTSIYASRMQIEETFRDAKNPRFGWRLEYSGSRTPSRVDALLLVAAIAMVAALLVGLAAEELRLHYRYQANTRRDRRVLSLINLGRRILIAPPTDLACDLSSLFGRLKRREANLQAGES